MPKAQRWAIGINGMLKKYLKITAVFVVLTGAALGLRFLYSISYGTVTVVNDSHEELSGVVAVCGQSFNVPGLMPGERHKIRYELVSDSSYAVAVKFKSGKELRQDVGYVTNGMEFDDELHVTDKDIEVVCRH